VVRVKGLEPPRQRRLDLNQVRLPIPPHPHMSYSDNQGINKGLRGMRAENAQKAYHFKKVKKMHDISNFLS
jgi:hypothetical protein